MLWADLIKPIPLPPDKLRQLGGILTEIVRDLESAHSRYYDNIRIWWRWYEAEPRSKTKNHPWPNSSNVVAPVIRTQADARTAQDFSMIWGTKTKLYSGRSENEDFARRYQGPVMGFLNWAIESEVQPFWTILDWLHERNVIGRSVFSAAWDEQQRHIFAPGSTRPEPVIMRRGVKWTHHPAESILSEPGTPIRQSDTIVLQRFLYQSDLARLLQQPDGGYNEEALERLLGTPHEKGSPGAEVRADKEARAGIDDGLHTSHRRRYDVRTLWLDWPILGGLGVAGLKDLATIEYGDGEDLERIHVPLIVELAPDTQEVLRVLPNPYLMADGNPFFDAYYRRQVGYPFGVGLAKILEGPQRAQSTIVNQTIDSRTLQNALPFKTTDPKLKERPITPGSGLYVSNMQDVEAFSIPSGSPMDMALANMMQVWAERAGGSNDPMIGRESRSGGHPSPATNYMGQLQQAAKMGSVPTFIMDEQLAAAGLYTASLYQQFDTDEGGRLTRVFGQADASIVRDWLFPTDMTLVGNLQLRLTALSEDNPQSAQQRALMTAQVTQAYFANILKLMQVLSLPDQQVPAPVKKAAIQAVKVLGDTHQQFLEASDYDEAYEAILRLDEGDMSAIAQLAAIAQQTQQGAPAGPGGPPGAGGPGAGASPPGQPGPDGMEAGAGEPPSGPQPSPAFGVQ